MAPTFENMHTCSGCCQFEICSPSCPQPIFLRRTSSPAALDLMSPLLRPPSKQPSTSFSPLLLALERVCFSTERGPSSVVPDSRMQRAVDRHCFKSTVHLPTLLDGRQADAHRLPNAAGTQTRGRARVFVQAADRHHPTAASFSAADALAVEAPPSPSARLRVVGYSRCLPGFGGLANASL